jgi:hypothetical protein
MCNISSRVLSITYSALPKDIWYNISDKDDDKTSHWFGPFTVSQNLWQGKAKALVSNTLIHILLTSLWKSEAVRAYFDIYIYIHTYIYIHIYIYIYTFEQCYYSVQMQQIILPILNMYARLNCLPKTICRYAVFTRYLCCGRYCSFKFAQEI